MKLAPNDSLERRVALKAPNSAWFFFAIIFVPAGIGSLVTWPLNWKADLLGFLAISLLLHLIRIATRKVFLSDDGIILRGFLSRKKMVAWDEVRVLRFSTTSWQYGSYGGAISYKGAIFVRAKHGTFHFIVQPHESPFINQALAGMCKNAVIMDEDEGTLSPAKNPAAEANHHMRRYAWGMILRHGIVPALVAGGLVMIFAVECYNYVETRSDPSWLAVPVTVLACLAVIGVFAFDLYRFARRLLR